MATLMSLNNDDIASIKIDCTNDWSMFLLSLKSSIRTHIQFPTFSFGRSKLYLLSRFNKEFIL